MAFFRRYRQVMRLTYVALVLIAAVLFGIQVRTQYLTRLQIMDERFRQTAASLDYFIKGVADHVEAMRCTADRYWREDARATPFADLEGAIRDRPRGEGFALEPVPAPYTPRETANITGEGSAKGRSAYFRKSVRVALGLNPLYRTTLERLPNVAWSYYTSNERFIAMYPWPAWKDYHYGKIAMDSEYYTLGLPDKNPRRERFWTGVYVDQCGKGLMVTCGAPVYNGDRFAGTVSADATLDVLTSFLTQYPYRSSTLFVVSDRGELLAHPTKVHSTDKAPTSVAAALPTGLGLTPAALQRLTPNREHSFGPYIVVTQQFTNAPWKVVMVTRRSSVVASVAGVAAIPMVILLVGMTIMLLVANRVTQREFIEPAEKLVTHIDLASADPDVAPPDVPPAWRSWVETVSRVFTEHRSLLAQLREQNENLEQIVADRTAELSSRNKDLDEAMTRLKEMQRQIVTQEKMAALGGLTAGIAHEIKNPLNFVNNFSELSLGMLDEVKELLERNADKMDPDDAADLTDILGDLATNARKINEHGKRADSIVRGMLLHSRGKSGEMQASDLNALVAEYTNLAYHGMRAVDTEFNVKIEQELDPAVGKIQLVPQDLSRAVLNIVNNACYAAYEARKTRGADFQPTIRITTAALGDKVEIRVRDNGNGIPDDVREKVFTPFYTTKPTGKGTGLGLSITYDIVVQEHRGELTIDSAENEFTELIIRLPRTQGAVETPA